MRLLVVGAGGHAKVVVESARAAGFEIAGVIGQAGGRSELLGVPVSTSAEGIACDGFIAAVGDNAARAAIHERFIAEGFTPLTVIHPSAVLAEGVTIGRGTFVAAGVVVNVDARIGEDVILNTGCTVDHDCIVGDHALIGPCSSMCGASRVGAGVTFGAGAAIIPVRSVGDWSTVGAGAAVVDDIPGSVVCVGVPARVIREIER